MANEVSVPRDYLIGLEALVSGVLSNAEALATDMVEHGASVKARAKLSYIAGNAGMVASKQPPVSTNDERAEFHMQVHEHVNAKAKEMEVELHGE